MTENVLSKYSNKIIKFLNSTKNIDLHIQVPNIIKNINYDNKKKIYTKETFKIEKGIKNKYPLAYLLYIKSHNISFIDFLKKHRSGEIKNNLFKLIKCSGNKKELTELLYDNIFVSVDIQHHAETSDLILHKYIFQNSMQVYIYNIIGEKDINIDWIVELCEITHSMCKRKNKKYPKIIIFNGKQKKMFTRFYNDNLLAPENINSGASVSNEFIHVYRNEEIYKVLTHELVHYYNLDYPNNQKLNNIKNHYCTRDTNIDIPNEAYTETLAVLIHTLFVSKKINIDYQKLLQYEIMFSIYQVKKILDFYGVTLNEIYNKKCSKKIIVKTSVISYFVIKTGMLLNLDKFDNIINQLDQIGKYDDVLNNIKFPDVRGFLAETLRMTCIELY